MTITARYIPLDGNAPDFLQVVFQRSANVENPQFSMHVLTDVYRNHHFLYTSLACFEPFDQTVLEMTWSKPSLAVSSEATAPGSPISSPISSSKTEDRILQMLRDDPKCSAQQLGNALGISKCAVLKQIEKLKQQGRLSRIGSAKGGHWEVLK